MDVNPPIIWFSLVQIITNNEFLFLKSEGLPTIYWFTVLRLKIKFNFFFWKPSEVKKLANFGKYFFGQHLGSQSNSNLDIYNYYISS